MSLMKRRAQIKIFLIENTRGYKSVFKDGRRLAKITRKTIEKTKYMMDLAMEKTP